MITPNTHILYSSGCSRCRVLEKKLQLANLRYNIESSDFKILEKMGINELPVLYIPKLDQYLNFSDAVRYVNETAITIKKETDEAEKHIDPEKMIHECTDGQCFINPPLDGK